MASQHWSEVHVEGKSCGTWPGRGTEAGRCDAHAGPGSGGEDGGRDAYPRARKLQEGCTIEAVIDDLYRQQVLLSEAIDRLRTEEDATVTELTRLLRIHGQNASRLGRLLRDRRALSGDAADGISGAIGQALDELSNEWGIPL
jgi:hypothetical protein